MYRMYAKQCTGHLESFSFVQGVSLFGRNVGYIPKLLKRQLTRSSDEPLYWQLNVSEELIEHGEPGNSIIIDLKPGNAVGNLSLYELSEIWGVSGWGWTPLMFRLRALFVDCARDGFYDHKFEIEDSEIEEGIFSILYVNGSVSNGEICGKWTAPRASPTNSALLWPDTFEYFKEASSRWRG